MATLSVAVVFALAQSCQTLIAPSTLVGMAQRESGFDPRAVRVNSDGTRDFGLMQINSKNVAWLGLNDPFDPCQSIAAASRLLASFSRYNTGSPVRGIQNGYATRVTAAIGAINAMPSVPAAMVAPLPPPCAPAWDAWRFAACSKSPGKNDER